jgi:hypothetical protein
MYRYLISLSLLWCSCGGSKKEMPKLAVDAPVTRTDTSKAVATPVAVPVVDGTVASDTSPITCQTKGRLIETFSQNNATFERFERVEHEPQWLKVTLPNGSCKIITDEEFINANHQSCEFKDWDGDGFKDRINHFKWYYDVALFSKADNDFSHIIDGSFSGEQWVFDKAKSLKWQCMDNKWGGTYQLYSIMDRKQEVYSSIELTEKMDDQDNMVMTIHATLGKNGKPVKLDAETFFPKEPANESYEAGELRKKNAIEKYWRTNLAKILP